MNKNDNNVNTKHPETFQPVAPSELEQVNGGVETPYEGNWDAFYAAQKRINNQ